MISMTRHPFGPVKTASIKIHRQFAEILSMAMVTSKNGRKRRHYSNFDALNRAILAEFLAEIVRFPPRDSVPSAVKGARNDVSIFKKQ